MIKSPVFFKKDELRAWLKEEFPRDDLESLVPKEFYPCVIVASHHYDHGGYDGSIVVYYHEFQTARYQPVKEEKCTPEGPPIGYGR